MIDTNISSQSPINAGQNNELQATSLRRQEASIYASPVQDVRVIEGSYTRIISQEDKDSCRRRLDFDLSDREIEIVEN